MIPDSTSGARKETRAGDGDGDLTLLRPCAYRLQRVPGQHGPGISGDQELGRVRRGRPPGVRVQYGGDVAAIAVEGQLPHEDEGGKPGRLRGERDSVGIDLARIQIPQGPIGSIRSTNMSSPRTVASPCSLRAARNTASPPGGESARRRPRTAPSMWAKARSRSGYRPAHPSLNATSQSFVTRVAPRAGPQ